MMGTGRTTVSVIVPSFQQGPYIRSCIESIISQENVQVEVLVFDSESSDETAEVLKVFENRAEVLVERDLGQAHAINKGLKRCKGDIIGFLNSDDVLMPGSLEKVVDYWRTHSSVALLYGRAHYIDENGKVISDYRTEKWNRGKFQGECFICQPAAFWSRGIMEKIGFLDQSLECSMDYDYWLRIVASGGQVAYSDDYLACSRDYPQTKTRSMRGLIFWENFSILLKRIGFVHRNWIESYFHYLKYEKDAMFNQLIPSPGVLRTRLSTLLEWISRLYSKDVLWVDDRAHRII